MACCPWGKDSLSFSSAAPGAGWLWECPSLLHTSAGHAAWRAAHALTLCMTRTDQPRCKGSTLLPDCCLSFRSSNPSTHRLHAHLPAPLFSCPTALYSPSHLQSGRQVWSAVEAAQPPWTTTLSCHCTHPHLQSGPSAPPLTPRIPRQPSQPAGTLRAGHLHPALLTPDQPCTPLITRPHLAGAV